MTLKEVSQRAYDYARAAVAVEQRSSKNAAHAQKGTWDKNMSALNDQINNPGKSSIRKHPTSSPQATPTASPYASGPYAQNGVMGTEANGTTQNTAQKPNIDGWGNAFESLGLNGFGDIGKNLGYVLAMLPDMIIGMFTGKTPNLKLQDNLMPLAAIVGGMFVKSPLLKLLLIGFGGANILNKAGHAAISDGLAKSNNVAKTYKVYPDEPLNSRIVNPAMKGSSMIATIDGVPSVINISRDAADAYNKGAIPINTLANAVLRKYDENKALASQNYEQHLSQEETTTQSMGIKILAQNQTASTIFKNTFAFPHTINVGSSDIVLSIGLAPKDEISLIFMLAVPENLLPNWESDLVKVYDMIFEIVGKPELQYEILKMENLEQLQGLLKRKGLII